MAAAGISIRTDCFCNHRAAAAAFALTVADVARARESNARTSDDHAAWVGIPGGGAIRAAVGVAANFGDVDRVLAAVETPIAIGNKPSPSPGAYAGGG